MMVVHGHGNRGVPADIVAGVSFDEDDPFAADTSRAFGSKLTGRPRGMRHPVPDKEDAWLTQEPLLDPQEIVARMKELDPLGAKELLDREQAKREARQAE